LTFATLLPRLAHANVKSKAPLALTICWWSGDSNIRKSGSPDGFIHFSTASQLAETARKFFFGQTGLFLIEVDAGALGEALRWEPSRNDELFPHLYGDLDLGAVTAVRSLHARSDGSHDIPELGS